ncbi:deoxyribodipyrimidine photo-lyase [Kordia algicida OT-1]|uniref:Deoxyribodipyrimidine photolyase-class I n=1 Tax=Kordia algicida OT-1 TaxID=391587 RepID=A9E3M9_9FLAO|nr:deoxyribodipyrimidine photo-lyase [Kordia algicida]EDP95241.1 deoxyribodipyrimidine photolyase-class I [Kordia algicida OT-1]
MKDNYVLFWHRRDLRIEDNIGLYHALNSGKKVIPLFIFDSDILEKLPKDDARVTFIYEELEKINTTLQSHDASILVKHGKPLEVLEEIIGKHEISAVYTNHDYEPYAIARDKEVGELLASKNIEFKTYKDQVIFERNEVVKADGDPYIIYTPYSKKWLDKLTKNDYTSVDCASYYKNYAKKSFNFPSLKDIGFTASSIKVLPYTMAENMIDNYEDTRNFPAIEGTSRLSPHLRFGTISVRKCVQNGLQSENNVFLKELVWREFFMQILWHFPKSVTNNFKSKYDGIKWRNDEDEYKAWCEGKTGYPLVDAGMRELNESGYMHNRVRMITASFLCKHLLIDWKWGEAYFAKKLLDFDLAQNVGNWQWVAGTGCDSSPYFRIFNPTSQIKKFDKDHTYINKWASDYQELTYPSPIVEHKFARERCLSTYKSGIES